MTEINHYEANAEFHFFYSSIRERLIELGDFLAHGQSFVKNAENKIGPGLEMYSEDFFEYYHAGSYGHIFRSSFIVTICSIAEGYIKEYLSTWKTVLKKDKLELKWNNGILEILKEADKNYFNLPLDFNKDIIVHFRCLLAVRNAMVHSNGNTEYVIKYIPLIKQLAKAFPTFELTSDGYILTSEEFCSDAMLIVRRMFFYISKLAIRKFPQYKLHKPTEDFWGF